MMRRMQSGLLVSGRAASGAAASGPITSTLLASALIACLLLAPETASTEEPQTTPTASVTDSRDQQPVAMPTFDAYLDSLRRRSAAPLDRRGVRDAWPIADSLEALAREQGPAFADTARDWSPPARVRFDFEPAMFTFNRIEGLRLGGRLRSRFGPVSLSGTAGYGLANEEWRHLERLRWRTDRTGQFDLIFGDQIIPYGLQPIPGNSVFALFAGADDHEYLRSRGGEIRWTLERGYRVDQAVFQVVDEFDVAATTDWNLLARDRGPRSDPPIVESRVHRLRLQAADQHRMRSFGGTVIRWEAAAEIAGYRLGGDIDYDRYHARLETDLHVPGRDDLRLTLEAGTARNTPPHQSLFHLGGPLALRAYPVHAFSGDRLLAASLDYFIGTDPLALMGLRWPQIQLVPFAEIGAVWSDPDVRQLFAQPASSDWRSDAGLALQRNILLGISARLDLAYRLDRDHDRLTTRFRFQTPLFNRLDEQ